MQKYKTLAKELKMVNAEIISPKDIYFDIRAIMKCRWGCEDFFKKSIKCHNRGTTLKERIAMIEQYTHILVAHSHNAHELSRALLDLERTAFLDGHYFAFTIRYCKLCNSCAVDREEECIQPEKVRPCDQSFGIDVYKTARNLGFPCNVLQNKDTTPDRYGFLLID